MKISELGKLIDSFCNPVLSESWDNPGFQISFGEKEVKRVLVALEITEEVIEEAVNSKAEAIVTHHPLIFGGISSIDENKIIGNHIIKLIQNEISVFSCHTDFDKMDGGNNDYLGRVLEMEDICRIDGDTEGYLRKGNLKEEMTVAELRNHIAGCLEINPLHIRIAGDTEKKVKKCAWCTGAGSDFMDTAFADGCDAYITGDTKYHEVQEAEFLGRTVIDAGHYGTEKIFTPNMAAMLKERVSDIEVIMSEQNLNPYRIIY